MTDKDFTTVDRHNRDVDRLDGRVDKLDEEKLGKAVFRAEFSPMKKVFWLVITLVITAVVGLALTFLQS